MNPAPNRLLTFYGLKWNPFAADMPVEGLWANQQIEHFAWRLEHLVHDGGFALIIGECGTGKSVALRLIDRRLAGLRDVLTGVLTRPQSRLGDFYRELGELFGVNLSPRNRWGGFKALRERWRNHLDSTLMRPVLLIDEAQAMPIDVLVELRLLASAPFDAASYLTVVLCGDGRLTELFRHEDLLPLASRIRVRLAMEHATRQQLTDMLRHVIDAAGNAQLMTDALIQTLAEHAAGNCRVLMTMAGQLLLEGLAYQQTHLDEKLYLQVFQPPHAGSPAKSAKRPGVKR